MRTLTAVLLLSSIGSIMGIRCYLCTLGVASSVVDSQQCDDPFNAPSSSTENGTTSSGVLDVDCSTVSPIYDVCAKTIGRINGVYTVARTCYSSFDCLSEDGCVSGQGNTVCCCGTDGCNGAGSVAVNIAATIFLAAATVMFTL
ncbi:uncharacterized protein [Asterias amurensis]|uniref:uncharacterized protein n=1 Tax=Asterias amurensis TaxID=7602 RepID=UPI003AB1ECC1